MIWRKKAAESDCVYYWNVCTFIFLLEWSNFGIVNESWRNTFIVTIFFTSSYDPGRGNFSICLRTGAVRQRYLSTHKERKGLAPIEMQNDSAKRGHAQEIASKNVACFDVQLYEYCAAHSASLNSTVSLQITSYALQYWGASWQQSRPQTWNAYIKGGIPAIPKTRDAIHHKLSTTSFDLRCKILVVSGGGSFVSTGSIGWIFGGRFCLGEYGINML